MRRHRIVVIISIVVAVVAAGLGILVALNADASPAAHRHAGPTAASTPSAASAAGHAGPTAPPTPTAPSSASKPPLRPRRVVRVPWVSTVYDDSRPPAFPG